MLKDMLRTTAYACAGAVLAIILLWFSSVLIRAVLSSPLTAAPAPAKKNKPVPPPAHVGTWSMMWKGSTFHDTKFNADGTYSCGTYWVGTWKLDGTTLQVRESNRDMTFTLDWAIIMSNGTSGVLIGDNTEFTLSPFTAPLEIPKVTD